MAAHLESADAPESTLPTARVHAIDYVRALAVVLVVAHHSVLAYHPFAPPPSASLTAEPRWWPAFPIVEPERWGGFAAFAGFNDMSLMALFFFVSGILVWGSLTRKGARAFFGDRLRRLGLPFLVGAGVLAPLAYYPAYLQIAAGADAASFWNQWLALEEWPSGPMWFLWVLLIFDGLAALLYVMPPRLVESLGELTAKLSSRPILFFVFLAIVSGLAYAPLRIAFHPLHWTLLGPFSFQTTRILLYLVYFLIGVGVGAFGLRRGLLAPQGKFAQSSSVWITVAFTSFGVTAGLAPFAEESPLLASLTVVGFVLTCAGATLAFLAVFLRYVRSSAPWADSLAANSYAVYLVHYPIVNWLQYALLGVALSVVLKGALVIVVALACSWAAAASLRRIPFIARFV